MYAERGSISLMLCNEIHQPKSGREYLHDDCKKKSPIWIERERERKSINDLLDLFTHAQHTSRLKVSINIKKKERFY